MKSNQHSVIAPICCAAAMVTAVHGAMKEVVATTPMSRRQGSIQKKLIAMEAALQIVMRELEEFRRLYDETLA